MPLTVGVIRETIAGERHVAMVPEIAQKLAKLGCTLVIEQGAGLAAHIGDDLFPADSVQLVATAADVFKRADILFKIQCPTPEEIRQLRPGTMLIGSLNPFRSLAQMGALRDAKVTCWATELIPRISRAQSMDTLSSQAAVAGYLGVLRAANLTPKFLPMLTTAAGTIRPAKVLVLGAGVAGLQAIATAKRLGAVIEAYDIRPETREQCESLGAKFVDTGIDASGSGGYARELTDQEKQQQKQILDQHIAKADCVITTAAIPGRPSPKLIDGAAVSNMRRGSVIVDLASEGGGNCELTKPGETIELNGVIIDGPLNLASQLSVHASDMFARNLFNFLSPHILDGELKIAWDDEIIAKSCVTRDGEIVHELVKKLAEEAGQ